MRIAISYPAYADTKRAFTTCLARMIVLTMSTDIRIDGALTRPTIEVFDMAGSDLAASRTALLSQALEWKAEYNLMLDVDHIFPADTLLRLLKHEVPVVGANYRRRTPPTLPTAAIITDPERGDGEFIESTAERAAATPLEAVDQLGLGLCLMNMNALEVVAQHEQTRALPPLFHFDVGENGRRISEDVYFFRRLRAAGVPVYVDHVLSREVQHIGECQIGFG
jgi:hypothetical protein